MAIAHLPCLPKKRLASETLRLSQSMPVSYTHLRFLCPQNPSLNHSRSSESLYKRHRILPQNLSLIHICSHVEQNYRNAFGLKKSKSIDWLKLNVSLAKRFFGKQGRWAIAIDPSYISKAGKKTPHIGRFWSGCAQSVKHGLEIMGIGLIDIDAKE